MLERSFAGQIDELGGAPHIAGVEFSPRRPTPTTPRAEPTVPPPLAGVIASVL